MFALQFETEFGTRTADLSGEPLRIKAQEAMSALTASVRLPRIPHSSCTLINIWDSSLHPEAHSPLTPIFHTQYPA